MSGNAPAPRLVERFCPLRYRVIGNSMLPTLSHEQRVLSVSLRWPWSRLRRGDIVILQHPYQDRTSIKRVVGLPEEYIQIDEEGVWINGIFLWEPYLLTTRGTDKGKARQWMLDTEEYFVLGDNRADSEDSRDFGLVRRERLWRRVWPRRQPLPVFRI